MGDHSGTTVRPPAPGGVRVLPVQRTASGDHALRPRPDLVGSAVAADAEARRRIAARRWSRRAQQAARRAARASASVS